MDDLKRISEESRNLLTNPKSAVQEVLVFTQEIRNQLGQLFFYLSTYLVPIYSMTICYAEEVDPLLSAKIRLKSIAILVYFMRIARLLAAGSCKCKFSNGVYSLVVDYFLSRAAVRNFDFFNCFNVLLNFLIFLLLQHICDQLLMLLKFM